MVNPEDLLLQQPCQSCGLPGEERTSRRMPRSVESLTPAGTGTLEVAITQLWERNRQGATMRRTLAQTRGGLGGP